MKERVHLDAGFFNQRLKLQRNVETPDGCGGIAVTWEDIDEIWAHLKPVSERTSQIAQQNEETQSHKITVRFRDDILSGWRFQLATRVFQILTIQDPDERGNYLICTTKEEAR